MLAAATITALALAATVGLLLKRFSGTNDQGTEKDAVDVPKVLGSTSLLAGLLIAIVLSDASGTYTTAKTSAEAEANTVDNLYESAEYLQQPLRQRMQAAVVCYARAVVGPEWDAMAKGEGSTVPSNWTGTKPGGIRGVLLKLTPAAPEFDDLQQADVIRGDQRNQRLAQAKPAVPTVLYAFMIFLLTLSLAGLAYSIPRQNNAAQLAALATVTVLFSIVMLMIANFDRPFGGVLKYGPSAMMKTEQDDSADYKVAYGIAPPCDARGNPNPT